MHALAHCYILQAFQRGLRYPRNQFLLLGEYNDEWLVEVNPNRDLGCTLKERRETLSYAVTVNIPNNVDKDTDMLVSDEVPLWLR